jgi:hypothetical protein
VNLPFHIFGSSVVGSIFKEIKVSLGDWISVCVPALVTNWVAPSFFIWG